MHVKVSVNFLKLNTEITRITCYLYNLCGIMYLCGTDRWCGRRTMSL